MQPGHPAGLLWLSHSPLGLLELALLQFDLLREREGGPRRRFALPAAVEVALAGSSPLPAG